ncbi:MAG TPA: alkaline phosphatase family protein [Microlunatus sp.]
MANTQPSSVPVTNVFVLMLENHSFDHIFGWSGIGGITVATAEDSNTYDGIAYPFTGDAPSSMTTDPGHEFPDVLEQLCGARAAAEYLENIATGCAGPVETFAYPGIDNSGFVSSYARSTSEGTGRPDARHLKDIMSGFDTSTQLPVMNALAREFAICDFWFSSLPGPTWPNRFFVHGASASGMDRSPSLHEELEWETYHGFEYGNGSIFASLQAAGHGWRLYQDKDNSFSDHPSGAAQGGWISQVAALRGVSLLDVHSLKNLEQDLREGDGAAYREQYPYTFIEPNFGASFFSPQPPEPGPRYIGGSSQHPEDDPYGGEGLIKFVYETIRSSPLWESSLLVIVYDEHGGFYDSVPPGPAVPPADPIPKGQKDLNTHCFDFSRLGVRVPAVVVSPFIARGTVDHTIYDHTSILATVERMLGLPALTNRDEAANDVWHLLSTEARSDCPELLPERAEVPDPPHAGTDQSRDIDDESLPASGNLIGFLHILVKEEIALAEKVGGPTAAEIVAQFRTITTHRRAREYVEKMKQVLDEAVG